MDKYIQSVIYRISELKACMIDMYEATDDDTRKRKLEDMYKLTYRASRARAFAINAKEYTGYEGDVLRLRDIERDLDAMPPTTGFKDWIRREIRSGNLKPSLQHVHARQAIHRWQEFDLPWIWSCKGLFDDHPKINKPKIKDHDTY